MYPFAIEVLLWTFAIYGFVQFVKGNIWDFIKFVRKIYVKFIAKKKR